MARVHQRKGQRHVSRFPVEVLIETNVGLRLRGTLIDESRTGIGVVIEGEQPELKLNQRIWIRCRVGNGPAKVRYVDEQEDLTFRVGIQWER